jgi:hypothetical protein
MPSIKTTFDPPHRTGSRSGVLTQLDDSYCRGLGEASWGRISIFRFLPADAKSGKWRYGPTAELFRKRGHRFPQAFPAHVSMALYLSSQVVYIAPTIPGTLSVLEIHSAMAAPLSSPS